MADQVNDRYLKANGQKDGVESYDRMADLIVAWYLEQRKRRLRFSGNRFKTYSAGVPRD